MIEIEDDKKFIARQLKALKYFKRIAEVLKNKKIIRDNNSVDE